MDSATNLPDLPTELERVIFEMVAEDDLQDGLRLSFVAKRVREWVEPIIYRRLVVYRTKWHTHDAELKLKPAVFPFKRTVDLAQLQTMRFARHVHTLYVANITVLELSTLLTACTRISELGMSECVLDSSVLGLINARKLSRLSVGGKEDYFATSFNFPSRALTATLTHLDLTSERVPTGTLARFTRLTHLCFFAEHVAPEESWRESVFATLPQLKILLQISSVAVVQHARRLPPVCDDPRFIALAPPRSRYFPKGRLYVAHGCWEAAERIVEERAAKSKKTEKIPMLTSVTT
ncbi:hypothetical protein MIND_00120900 [Mycena indigotica]|uniref:F-box domain-containing protein n=1 Tax=Mycena indigotica TaxID=2126181 RepID=A0A8H6TG05_9AGAR|nr:uncharacterized protein MIND_00120900 [Mycena indigotica]KAF7316032.1 hypothetical protein MIND_00120900 [Mycena indigotica]